MEKQFSSSEYMFSVAGVLKIFSIILFIVSAILFLAIDVCPNTPHWYPTLFPIFMVASGVIVSVLYTVFVVGFVKRDLNFWTIIDLFTTSTIFISSLVVGIISLITCRTSGVLQYIPTPIGIFGSVLLAISTTASFMRWRSIKDENEQEEFAPPTPQFDPNAHRKSIYI